MILLPLLLVLCIVCCTLCASPTQCDFPYLAVCVIAKDEIDLPEWLEYHRRMGVAKFYIFDHNSSTPMINSILPHVKSGLVEYRYLVGIDYQPAPQLWVFNKCLKDFGALHKFMAFIDVDEFIVVKDRTKKIPDILRQYEDFDGLALNWRMMGMSGHLTRPEGGVLKNYNKCGNDYHVKSIVNPERTLVAESPHNFIYKDNGYAIDTPKRTGVQGPMNPGPSMEPPKELFDVMYVNHYASKSLEDYLNKITRGRSDDPSAAPRNMALLGSHERVAADECEYLEMPEDDAGGNYCWQSS